MNDNDKIFGPDELGWYFFKKNKKASPIVVFINDDGVANYMEESGETGQLDDLIGEWFQIEAEFTP